MSRVIRGQRILGNLFKHVFRIISGLAHGIRCYKCGQYNEGVGSITPCINYTANMHLKECPPSAEWCIVSTSLYYLLFFKLESCEINFCKRKEEKQKKDWCIHFGILFLGTLKYRNIENTNMTKNNIEIVKYRRIVCLILFRRDEKG